MQQQPSIASFDQHGHLVVLDAPTNLGLRPPAPGAVPGADKAPSALRDVGLHESLRLRGAHEAGAVLAGRYQSRQAHGELRNQPALLGHAGRLAERIGQSMDQAEQVLVLGGDYRILLATAITLRRRGRYGFTTHLSTSTRRRFNLPANRR